MVDGEPTPAEGGHEHRSEGAAARPTPPGWAIGPPPGLGGVTEGADAAWGPTVGTEGPTRAAGHRPPALDLRPGTAATRGPIVVAALALAGASATRMLDGWAEGRWWMLDVGLVAVAGVAALVGVVRGVSAVGTARRHGATLAQVAGGVVALVVVSALLWATGLRAVDDGHDLDVPAAWDRVDLRIQERRDPLDGYRFDGDSATSARPPAEAPEGTCYAAADLDPDDLVPCDEPHGVQVLRLVDLEGEAGYPRVSELSTQARLACEADLARTDLPDGLVAGTVVPDRDAWTGGARQAACVVRAASGTTTEVVATGG